MLRLEVLFVAPNLGAAKRNLRRRLFERTYKAYAAYIRAVLEKIPVYSGESRESLTPAARLLGVPNFYVPVAASQKPHVSKGRATVVKQLDVLTLVIESDVLQLTINDIINVNALFPGFFRLKHPGPYKLSDVGQQAFEAVIAGGIVKDLTLFASDAFDTRNARKIRV